MKILIAAGVPKRREGGVAAIAYNLGSELSRLGHEVSYTFSEDLLKPDLRHSRFDETIFSFRLARYICQHSDRFDVVNLHAPCGLAYGLWRSWKLGAGYPPYVMTLHGLEERRVHAMKREAVKGRAWNFARKNRMWHRLYHFPRFRWAIRTANGAYAFSRDVWNYLVLNYDLDDELTQYIPLGVEERFLRQRQYGLSGPARLLYAGTWLDQRGIFYIKDALLKLAPRLDFTITFAGTGVPAEDIWRFFGQELRSRVQVRDTVPSTFMPQIYADHDIFIFPSLMEGLPNVLQEAMAGGMPVITTETCGMPDIVESDFNGVLVPPADALALEEAIARLVTSEELRSQLGRAAHETMRRYTWQRAGRRLEALLLQVIQRCRQ